MSVIDHLKNEKAITLNKQQIEAVQKIDGPILLLAVPGSGKTTVLIARIRAMILEHGIDPRSILNLTFSTESAKDMSSRYVDLFGEDHRDNLEFRTVHSLCYRIIKVYEQKKNRKAFEVLDQNTAMIRNLLIAQHQEFPLDETVFAVAQMIGYCKNMLMPVAEIEKTDVPGCDFYAIYQAYEQAKLSQRLMDYDDLLVYALRILNAHGDILAHYHRQYLYINVDEAQDISYVQHEIIRLLASKQLNIFMVGDEDQSIYGFRAAYPKALMDFGSQYPSGTILKMEQNFRSTQAIIQSANGLIRENRERYEKTMFTANVAGKALIETHFNDQFEQYAYLAKVLKQKNEAWSTAVLYRNNDSMIPLYDALEREGIPVSFRQAQVSFFNHVIVRDVNCFMKLAIDPGDAEAFEKVYYKLKCGLTKELMFQVIEMRPPHVFKALLSHPQLSDGMRKKIGIVMDKVAKLSKLKPLKAIESIEKELGYSDFMKKLSGEGFSSAAIPQKMNAMKSIARRCSDLRDFMERMTFLEQGCLVRRQDAYGTVVLSTIHSSKGLEFDHIFLIDVLEGILPSKESVAQLKIGKRTMYEEEVRLFYVALTRAKDEIQCLTAATANGQSISTSRFLDLAIPNRSTKGDKNEKKQSHMFNLAQPKSKVHQKKVVTEETLASFTQGVKIKHKTFGFGIVESVYKGTLDVWFGSELKSIDLRICLESGILELMN